MNIRRRLALQFSFITTILLIFFSVAIYYSSSYFRQKDFNSRLYENAHSKSRLLVDVRKVDSSLFRIIGQNTLAVYQENVRIFDNNDRQIYCNSDTVYDVLSNDFLKEIRKENEAKCTRNNREIIGMVFKKEGENYVIVVSGFDKYGLNKMHYLRLILFAGILMGSLISVLLGLLFAGRALKPISLIIDQAKKISASRIDLRLHAGSGRDELARLSITINDLLDRLEHSIELQKSFVSNASHELRTPFSLILAEIEIALLEERSKEKYIETLRSISDEVKSLNALSDDLLELTQVSQDVPQFNCAPVRVDELLLQLRIDLMKRNSKCNVIIDDITLPEDEELVTVCGNETLLKTAFFNIMTNACKFSFDHEMHLKFYAVDRTVCVEFIDKGIGIPDDELDRIFDPFFRGSNITGRQGHGLGLPLVKKIIELHHGTIEVFSNLNRGSRFLVKLPVAKADEVVGNSFNVPGGE